MPNSLLELKIRKIFEEEDIWQKYKFQLIM